MIKEAIKILVEGKDLSSEMMKSSISEIMEGKASPAEIASFLTALRMKSETPVEIASAAEVMREKSRRINIKLEKLMDTCGTGGDGLHTFNISTLVAIALSSYGIAIAKHGNRSVSSSSGSADLIEALGIPLLKESQLIKEAIEEIGFGYIFAPYFHPAMKYATPVRREIGIRTIFNILGPLANPASPNYQILGVYSSELLEPIVLALKNLNLKSALVVHARDGMDEISLSALTEAYFLKDGEIKKFQIDPKVFGIKKIKMEQLRVESLEQAVEKAFKVLKGEDGPELEIVAFNAGWALFVLSEVETAEEGYLKIKELLKAEKALKKLEQIRKYFSHVNTG